MLYNKFFISVFVLSRENDFFLLNTIYKLTFIFYTYFLALIYNSARLRKTFMNILLGQSIAQCIFIIK